MCIRYAFEKKAITNECNRQPSLILNIIRICNISALKIKF